MESNDKKELELKRNFFSAQHELRTFLCNKHWKYNGKPIELKPKVYPKQKDRIGFYIKNQMPIFINDARTHLVSFGAKKYVLCEDEFVVYKKPIKDKEGKLIHFVDVKCPDCSHLSLIDMRYLVWGYNCRQCKHVIGVSHRVKKSKFNMSDYR